MEQKEKKWRYMNPYLAGVFLGLVLTASFFLAGQGLGASGAAKSIIAGAVVKIAPEHAANSGFYKKYTDKEESPLHSWLVFEVLGVLIGGFLSGAISKRLTWKVEKSPKITNIRRIIFAIIGGVLFGMGAQLAKGCTSGAALSGMASLALTGFITMIAIFGTAFIGSFFFKKNWI